MSELATPRRAALAVAAALALVALLLGASNAMASSAGDVYTQTNSPAGNAVKVFDRAGDGSLTPVGEFSTGGSGAGGGLGNQSSVVLDGNRLFAVNTGSDSISAFAVKRDSVKLIDTIGSGGDHR